MCLVGVFFLGTALSPNSGTNGNSPRYTEYNSNKHKHNKHIQIIKKRIFDIDFVTMYQVFKTAYSKVVKMNKSRDI